MRDATIKDVDFVAWAALAASRSHLDRSLWEYVYDVSEEMALDFLRRLAVTDAVQMNHYSLFLVAEVDGEPAAAMCAYDSSTQGFDVFGAAVAAVAAACGFDRESPAAARRFEVMMSGYDYDVEFPPVMWSVEYAATAPAFRGRGLAGALLDEHLRRGRERGYEHAMIGVYLENEPAHATYRKAGFEVVSECRSEGWASEIGCPGTAMMLMTL